MPEILRGRSEIANSLVRWLEALDSWTIEVLSTSVLTPGSSRRYGGARLARTVVHRSSFVRRRRQKSRTARFFARSLATQTSPQPSPTSACRSPIVGRGVGRGHRRQNHW
jgi:hypothetical protein